MTLKGSLRYPLNSGHARTQRSHPAGLQPLVLGPEYPRHTGRVTCLTCLTCLVNARSIRLPDVLIPATCLKSLQPLQPIAELLHPYFTRITFPRPSG